MTFAELPTVPLNFGYSGSAGTMTAALHLEAWDGGWEVIEDNSTGIFRAERPLVVEVNKADLEPVALSSRTLRSEDDGVRRWLQTASDEVGALEDGWSGPGTLAPTSAVKASFRRVLAALPMNVLEPEFEVDPSTGVVAMRWFAADDQRAFSLVCAKGDEVIATLSTSGEAPHSWRQQTWNRAEVAKRVTSVDFIQHAP